MFNLSRLINRMPKAPTTSTPNAIASSSSSPKLTPKTYRALKTEQGVFTTPPYSGELKGLWKFKDEDIARQSAESLWERFEVYRYVITIRPLIMMLMKRKDEDFVGYVK
jgi:hypothetical protein